VRLAFAEALAQAGGQACIPFPLPRGRGGDLEDGLTPLLNTLLFHSGRVKERRSLSYKKSSSSPLRERGIMGARVLAIGLKKLKS